MAFKSSKALFKAVEDLDALWETKAVAEPARVAKRTAFMVTHGREDRNVRQQLEKGIGGANVGQPDL